jgi:hypothetical protein
MKLFGGAQTLMAEFTRFYAIWTKYGEKIGLGAELTPPEASKVIDDTFSNIVGKMHNHISWHIGMTAYKLIKKEEKAKPPPENEDEADDVKKKRKVEKYREQLIQTVTKSNLLSGGIEVKHMTKISDKAQEELKAMASLMGD